MWDSRASVQSQSPKVHFEPIKCPFFNILSDSVKQDSSLWLNAGWLFESCYIKTIVYAQTGSYLPSDPPHQKGMGCAPFLHAHAYHDPVDYMHM